MSIITKKFASAGGALLLAGVILSSCTVVVDEGPRPLPPEPGPVVCTQEYAPVCARRGDNIRTFGNACEARARNYRIIHDGECRPSGPPPQFCTREYAPVCARRGPSTRTFGNACEAETAGYRILYAGRC